MNTEKDIASKYMTLKHGHNQTNLEIGMCIDSKNSYLGY